MTGAQRYESGLIFRHKISRIAAGYLCSSMYDDPMLSAMMVHLKRQRSARLDDDPLYLETLARIDSVIPAPGAEYLTVQLTLRPALALEIIHNFLYMLCFVHVSHENGIRGFNHHHILHPHAGYQPVLGQGQYVAAIIQQHVALR